MDISRLLGALGIGAVICYAFGSSAFVTNSSAWYLSLTLPDWQPPNWVFGVIWPYNFFVLAIASWQIPRSESRLVSVLWLVFLIASVTAALCWSYFFYQPHNLALAALTLAVAALLTVPLLVICFYSAVGLGLAILPYQIWIILAATLSHSIYQLNS